MVEALTAGVLSALAVAFVVAVRYALLPSRRSLLFSAAIVLEIGFLGVLLLVLGSQLFFGAPWFEIDLEPLAQEAVATFFVVVALGACFWYSTKLEAKGKRIEGAFLFGGATALLIGALFLGIWAAQESGDAAVSASVAASPILSLPADTPSPTPTPTPTPGPTDISTTLTRGPYLGRCSTKSVTVAWLTDVAATSVVKYGTTPLMESRRSDANTRFQHAVTLDGLAPNTKYFYQVISNRQAMTVPGTFTTSKSKDELDFTFAVFGDTGIGGLAQFAIASRLQAADPDFLLHTGDVVYRNKARALLIEDGLLEDYEYNPQLTEPEHWDPYYFVPYQNIIDSRCIFTSLGNHDSPKAYLEALYLPSNNLQISEFYYSFDYGRAHIIALDSNNSAGKPSYDDTAQFRWLRADLQGASQDPEIDWTFVFFHHAPFASGSVNSPRSRGPFMADAYVPVFEEFGVDLVFGGHDHTYERTCPIINGSCAAPGQKGTLYVVTGGGGHPILHPNECGQGCPWSEFRSSVFHFVDVTVNGNKLMGKTIDIDGTVIDTFSIEKGP